MTRAPRYAAALWHVAAGAAEALARAPASRAASTEAWARAAGRALEALGVELTLDVRAPPRSAQGPGRVYVHLDQQTLLSALLYPVLVRRPLRLVVNAEFALLPFIGPMVVAQGATVVVRQWPAQARRALARLRQRLEAGDDVGISIEGRRSADGRLTPYKKGPVVLALEAQADLVPFMTHGEWAVWPGSRGRPRPGRIEAVVYPPIPTKGLGYADREALVARLWQLAVDERRRRGRTDDPTA